MSQDNVEIVRRGIEAAIRRPKPDFATMNELYHPDHEFISRLEAKSGGVPLVEEQNGSIVTLREGQITRTEVYPSVEQALEADRSLR